MGLKSIKEDTLIKKYKATKLSCKHDWNDLMLPKETLQLLREITMAMKHRKAITVHTGFEQRLGASKGVSALFNGSSGTGKTMAASLLGKESRHDVYRIDLSLMISKYIGETEKNLNRIFDATQSNNAILYFDGADALFGKRTKVKDAHDRYGNIEITYLLQRIEEHDGLVILETNLSENMCKPFLRRIDYCVDFPVPNKFCR